MLLGNRNAVIYGGGGSIGRAVARAFAREGAKVFLAGRTLSKLEAVAEDIRAAGGEVETAKADALNEQSVKKHIAGVAKKAGRIDVSFNAISWEDVQGTPLIEMALDDFSHPILIATKTQFLTAKAVAPHMIENRSGVIMTITAQPGRIGFPLCGASAWHVPPSRVFLAAWQPSLGRWACASSACGRLGRRSQLLRRWMLTPRPAKRHVTSSSLPSRR